MGTQAGGTATRDRSRTDASAGCLWAVSLAGLATTYVAIVINSYYDRKGELLLGGALFYLALILGGDALCLAAGVALVSRPPATGQRRSLIRWFPLLGGLAPWAVIGGPAVVRTLQDRSVEHDRTQIQALAIRINNCLLDYRRAHPLEGYPAALGDIGPREAGCTSSPDDAAQAIGYRLAYAPSLQEAGGTRRAYMLCALSLARGGPRVGAILATDNRGHMVYGRRTDGASDLLTCSSVWSDDGPEQALRYCLLAYPAATGASTYPADISALGVLGCEALSSGLDYRPGPADSAGRRTTFTIGSWGNRRIDDSGERVVLPTHE